jgi:hypothetical protein
VLVALDVEFVALVVRERVIVALVIELGSEDGWLLVLTCFF